MKRDYFRDIATLAFVRYGELRGKSAEEYCTQMKSDIIEETKYTDPAMVNQRLISEMQRLSGFFEDLYAVEEVFGYFEATNREYIIDAVRFVYMSHSRPPSHKETIYRVRAHAMNVPVSEKQVYKWLEMARTLFAKKRGLAIEVPPGFSGSRS